MAGLEKVVAEWEHFDNHAIWRTLQISVGPSFIKTPTLE
jgi:hypothetical protein